MSTVETRCLESFPSWLKQLSTDALALVELISAGTLTPDQVPTLDDRDSLSTIELGPEWTSARRVAGALNYLFKSLDLIPDGIEDLGYIDDAFVFRMCAKHALEATEQRPDVLVRLAEDTELIAEFLGEEDFARLDKYVQSVTESTARGRSVTHLLLRPDVRAGFVAEVERWAEEYSPPAFAADEKNLVRLRSFLATKLPS